MSLFEALQTCEELLGIKKFEALHKPFVLRICEEEHRKHKNDRERLKASKSVLNALYGVNLSWDSVSKAERYLDDIADTYDEARIKKLTDKILHLHTSTKERMRNMAEFYKFIFDTVGNAETVLDLGCGFNPFSLSYFPNNGDNITRYYAFDIDRYMEDLNNQYFKYRGLPTLAKSADLAMNIPVETADVAFLFKFLPLIEQQSKGQGARLLRKINAKHMVISCPTKPSAIKEEGMQAFHNATFEDVIGGTLFVTTKKEIGDELVYIVSK